MATRVGASVVRSSSRSRSCWVGLIGVGAILGVSAAVACDSTTAPAPLPLDAERFEPPAVYARWWAMTEACAGRSRSLASVRWYRVPGPAFRLEDGEIVGGVFDRLANRIVLAEAYLDDGSIVRHEMLHAIGGVRGHPTELFLERCAPILSCGACEAWRPPGRDYALLPPDSLEIASDARMLPREVDGQRWLALWVSVRNPRERPVVAVTPGNGLTPPTFGFRLFGPVGNSMNGLESAEVATDSSVLFFQPLETKRWLYEFRVDTGFSRTTVSPGRHLVSGGYAQRWAAFDTVDVVP